jgi:CRP/FNR family transcriptional regulator, cyclic AMP receptor protein
MPKLHDSCAEDIFRGLRRHQLFDGATVKTVRACQRFFTQRRFPDKRSLFDQGDPSREVSLVVLGKVRIGRTAPGGGRAAIAVLGCGDIIGAEMLFTGTFFRTSRATAMGEASLCSADVDDFAAILTRYPSLAINFAKYFLNQRDDALTMAVELTSLKVRERILQLFVRLGAAYGVRESGGTLINVPLTHVEIASMVGSSRETVSLEMSRLRRSGHLLSASGSYVLPVLRDPGSHYPRRLRERDA